MLDDNLVVAARLIQGDVGANQHLLPVLWAKRHPAVAVAEHRAAHPGVIVFKVKYQWPEEGWLKLEISPLIQTGPFRAQAADAPSD